MFDIAQTLIEQVKLKSSVLHVARVCEGDGLVEDNLMGVDCFLTGDEVV